MVWHYVDGDGQSQGPVAIGNLKELAAAGTITVETLVWKDGMTEWLPYEQVVGTLSEGDASGGDVEAGVTDGTDSPTPLSELTPPAQDYGALRDELLAKIENKKINASVTALAPGPYNYPTLFPKTKGMGHKGQIKARVKVLEAIQDILPKILYPGEEVGFVTNGIYSSFGEQYFLGWISLLINRTVFVFTNYRIIMMNAGGSHKPRQMKWQLPYDQIKKFKSGGLGGSLSFKLIDKTSYSFSSVPGYDRKFLRTYIQQMIDTVEKDDFHLPVHQSRDHLCTACYAPVPKKTYTCPECGEEFIKPMTPALMSLCLPCLGDFYMGHRLVGCMELFGYMLALLIFGGILAAEGAKALLFIIPILAFEHAMDFGFTLHMGKKGLVSLSKAWRGH